MTSYLALFYDRRTNVSDRQYGYYLIGAPVRGILTYRGPRPKKDTELVEQIQQRLPPDQILEPANQVPNRIVREFVNSGLMLQSKREVRKVITALNGK